MGGIALGKGVTASGLLSTADEGIYRMLEGKQLYTIVLLLSVAVLVCRIVSPTGSVSPNPSDHFHLHKSYHCQRPPCPDR